MSYQLLLVDGWMAFCRAPIFSTSLYVRLSSSFKVSKPDLSGILVYTLGASWILTGKRHMS
jgi:hypothetical protein